MYCFLTPYANQANWTNLVVLHANIVNYRGLNSPFNWYNPIVHTGDYASGILLTVKGGLPVSSRVEKQYNAGKDSEDATLATLVISATTAGLFCGAPVVVAGRCLIEAFSGVQCKL